MSPRRNSDRQSRPRGFWGWLDLSSKLAVPFVVLIATLWFTLWQNHLTDTQNQDDVVETYISDMKHLVNQDPSAAGESQAAEEETITALGRLDAQHNQTVLQFLQEAHLIGEPNPVIDLSNADLSHDDLSGAPLSDVDLTNANLSHANLSGADLSGATMYSANLTGADLSGATLAGASLSSAILTGANLSDADLSSADLPGADITQSQLDVLRSCTDTTLPGGVTCEPICRFVSPSTRFLSPVRICQQSPPIQLTYWYTETGAQEKAVLKLVGEFNKGHRDIHVNAVYQNFFGALTAFTTAVQDDDAPDVFRSDVTWTPLLASKGYLLNINSYVSQSDLSGYLNAPLNTIQGIPPSTISGIGPGRSAPLVYDERKDDNLYGLPQVTNFLVLLYNQTELNNAGISPPGTMEEFKNDVAEIVRRKAAKYGFEFGGTSYFALPFLYACGGGMFDQYDNIIVNNTGSVAGLNLLMNLQNEEVDNMPVMPQVQRFRAPPPTMVSDFMNGKTAMIFDGPQVINQILTGSAFKGNHHNLGIAALPTGFAGQPNSPLGGESYVIYAGTAHPAEAYEFIQFMSLSSSQVTLANGGDSLPIFWSAYQNASSSYPSISTFLKLEDTVVAPPPVPQAAYLFDAADPDIWAALTGMQTADEALNAIAYSWEQLGAGNLVSQYTSTPGTTAAAC
jgi:arabinogalactan oligomer / maltooligosaccharide transport system substrate-binding protein